MGEHSLRAKERSIERTDEASGKLCQSHYTAAATGNHLPRAYLRLVMMVCICVCVCVGMLTPRDDGCGYGLYMSSMLATYNSKLHNDEIPDGN